MRRPETTCETDPPGDARARFRRREGGPLFLADWERVVFVHYTLPASALQPFVPLELDLRDGRACVSLVAFTQRRLRPAFLPGGNWVPRSLAQHQFLNVRTYVRARGERGIYFLVEWVSSRLACLLGPRLYGLPYRLATIDYQPHDQPGEMNGRITADRELRFRGRVDPAATPCPCEAGSLDAFLLERYIAFTQRRRRLRSFRIWHTPWPQVRVDDMAVEGELLRSACPWIVAGQQLAAHYSAGVRDVWIGRPRCVSATRHPRAADAARLTTDELLRMTTDQ